MKTKFYTISSDLTPENRRRVFPMLFDWYYRESECTREAFEAVATMKEAQICIYPIDIIAAYEMGLKNKVDSFVQEAVHRHKKVWLYAAGDFGVSYPNPEVQVFRLGGLHSKMKSNEHIMPSFVNDPYTLGIKKGQDWKALPKPELPTIGFVGTADGSWTKFGKELLIFGKQSLFRILGKNKTEQQPFFAVSRQRYTYLEVLRNSKDLDCHFIYRNQYRAGATTAKDRAQTTAEFYQNMEDNLYTFCIRGAGNFSVRFYETLLMGRIPIVVDTDIRLPLNQKINWAAHCVWVKPNSNLIDAIKQFHKEHSEERLQNIQYENRQLALTLLDRQQYFIQIASRV